MAHSADFFRDEVRDGFYIPTAIKQGWAVTLDVLAEIDRVCEKHGIRYFADWGTLLGTVRHGGYVPWDDDLDICMLRDDYIRFREVADAELPSDFVIHDYERQENHRLFLARVVNHSRICFEEEYLAEHYNFPWLAGVDIFLKDYLYDDPEAEKERDAEILQILAVADSITDGKISPQAASERIAEFSDKYGARIPEGNGKETTVALYRLAEEQMARVQPSESCSVGQLFPWGLKGQPGEPKAYYEHVIRMPFEDTTMPVPAYYDAVLRARYGNFLDIHRAWGGHEYPYFEGQKADMERVAGETIGDFVFDREMLNRPVPDRSASLKATVRECLKAMRKLQQEARQAAEKGNKEACGRLLTDVQQLAVDLGTLTEQTKGAEKDNVKRMVSALEAYCESVYRCFLNMTVDEENAEPQALTGAQPDWKETETALQQVEETVTRELLERKEVLFLPTGAREWRAFEETYQRLMQDNSADVFVVPLPLLVKDPLGRIRMSEEEILAAAQTDQYPDNVECTDWRSYDVALHRPEFIYIQNPYDAKNPYLTVPSDFYAERLRHVTDCLVYRPIADTTEFGKEDRNDRYNMKHYVTAPGIVYADRVEVQSKNIREQYIDVLTGFAGEDTREAWNRKIGVRS